AGDGRRPWWHRARRRSLLGRVQVDRRETDQCRPRSAPLGFEKSSCGILIRTPGASSTSSGNSVYSRSPEKFSSNHSLMSSKSRSRAKNLLFACAASSARKRLEDRRCCRILQQI